MTTDCDAIVIGGGLAGLDAALRRRRAHPTARLAVVEATPRPGGSLHTVRSNGFVCELGAFALTADEVQPTLDLLPHPPRLLSAAPGLQGALFDGERLQPVAVDPMPLSFATGCEELAQACRRELGETLHLGRRANAVQHDGECFVVTLGGEVEATLCAPQLTIAVDPADAALLLGAFDPALPQVAAHVAQVGRAFVFLGGLAAEAPELRGYGVLAAPHLPGPAREAIFCTEVFANRALRDRCLVRVELGADEADVTDGALPSDDGAVSALAEAALRRWTGTAAPFAFRKVHRFTTPEHGGALAECRARIAELTRRVPHLTTT